MKKTMKKCFAMLLALAMLFAMAIPAAADETTDFKRTITFTEVAEGDTVKAYRVMEYGEDYNSYVFDAGFKHAMNSWHQENEESFDDYFASIKADSASLHLLIGMYVTGVLNGTLKDADTNTTFTLPKVYAEDTANAEGEVSLTLEPGYYLFLVTTTEENSKVYVPVTVFVQVKNNQVKIYAGENDADITESKTLNFKHAEGPTIDMKVKDDSLTTAAWRDAAAGSVDEVMDFYIQVEIPAYQSVTDIPTLNLVNTLSNLEYVAGSAKVYKVVMGENGNETATVVNNVLTETTGTNEDGTPNVTFKLKYNNPDVNNTIKNTDGSVGIYVHYKAVVKPEAAAKGVDATSSAVLKYATSAEPENVKTTDAVSTTVYTYAFSLSKYSDTLLDANDEAKGFETLTNAVFSVYDKDKTAVIKMVKETTAEDEVYFRPATTADAAENTVTELPADQGEGKNTLLVRGLDIGTYVVEEVKVPTGYYAPQGDFKVEFIGERTAVNNELTGVLMSTSRFVELNEADKLLPYGSSVNADEVGRLDASLKNSSSPLLPTTGGVGTVMFTVVGIALMGLALWFFLFRRRRDEE